MKKNILIVDDDRAICTVLEHALEDFDANIKITNSAKELQEWIKQGLGDCVLSDVIMEDGNGIDILKEIKLTRPDLPVVIMSANNTVLTAIDAGTYGAFEYLPKPFDLNELKTILYNALSMEKNNKKQVELNLPIVGKSKKMQSVYRSIAKLLNNNETVIINGESGTGKELVAKTLHDFGERKDKPFIAINMGAIPQELIESELFGYEKGAFTGADSDKKGKFLQAEGGTLFLDEIGDMPLDAQIRLLRVLQENEVSPIGSSKVYKCNVRIISATHKNLEKMIENGEFRQDLYYRLNVMKIDLPPLRERLDDINDLVEHFLTKINTNKVFDDTAYEQLKKYKWNGNLRELENLVRRICLISSASIIDDNEIINYLSKDDKATSNNNFNNIDDLLKYYINVYFSGEMPDNNVYNTFLRKLEAPLIQESLKYCNGNQIKTAEMLGINRNTLRKKINELEINIIKKQK
jgi:two-component system nitrogen regulation response regulator GlnG